MSKPETPDRRWEIEISVGADDLRSALSLLGEYVRDLRERLSDDMPAGEADRRITGGYDRGATCHVWHRPDQTHDKWAADLDAYLAALDALEDDHD